VCIFAGNRLQVAVSGTGIFAREVAPGVQALAYRMTISSADEAAMVLPLPVAAGAGEDAVRFVSLEHHPRMFEELDVLFPQPPVPRALSRSRQAAPLVVHEVGAFIASYAPSRADFARLDPRFRVADALFDAVPHYADYGFAVFQLRAGRHTVHPMALTFPTSAPGRLYFPTVHLHDGQFRDSAEFDHALYYQHPRCTVAGGSFGTDRDEVSELRAAAYEGLAALGQPVLRRRLRGTRPNRDTWIDAA
jgi:hypothetical protein